MRDYLRLRNDGSTIPIAQMSTAEIEQALREPILLNGGGNTTTNDVEERLRLELFIRENNLRGFLND